MVDFSRVQKKDIGRLLASSNKPKRTDSFVVDSVLILLRAPGLMSVGFGLAAIRASRERGHRDDRWQARRLHLFQPRLRGGRRRFPGGGRPPTPGGPPCSVSRWQHSAVGAPQSGHPQRLVGSSCFSMSRRPCWPGGRLLSPSGKRTSTTVRVSVPIRFSERPPRPGPPHQNRQTGTNGGSGIWRESELLRHIIASFHDVCGRFSYHQ